MPNIVEVFIFFRQSTGSKLILDPIIFRLFVDFFLRELSRVFTQFFRFFTELSRLFTSFQRKNFAKNRFAQVGQFKQNKIQWNMPRIDPTIVIFQCLQCIIFANFKCKFDSCFIICDNVLIIFYDFVLFLLII